MVSFLVKQIWWSSFFGWIDDELGSRDLCKASPKLSFKFLGSIWSDSSFSPHTDLLDFFAVAYSCLEALLLVSWCVWMNISAANSLFVFFWNLKVQRTFTKIVVFAVSFFFLNRNHMSFMKQLQFKSNVLPLVLFNTRGTFQVNHSSFRQIHLCFIGKKMPGLGHLGWGTIHNENPIYTWKKWVFLGYIIPFKRGSLGRLLEQLGPYHPKGPPRFSPMICWRWRV